MTSQLAKHGTQAGYKAELGATGKACPRCQKAHRVYNKQYTAAGKRKGLRYGAHDVIDNLYNPPGHTNFDRAIPTQDRANKNIVPDSPLDDPDEAPGSLSLAQRLGALLGSVQPPGGDPGTAQGAVYVEETGESHEYIRSVDPDPSPEGSEWEPALSDEFVINAAGMKKIQDNLGFYVSTIGMSLEIFDPYCGSVAAANAQNVIEHWSKVIALYPGTAKFFMSERSGGLFAWINAIQATWPILYAIYEHHFSKTVMTKDGIVYHKSANGQPSPDPTMPPVPDSYEYTAR